MVHESATGFLPTFPEDLDIPLKALIDLYYYVFFTSPFKLKWDDVTAQYYLHNSLLRHVKICKLNNRFLSFAI